jgi:hypothetical protein
MVDVSSEMLTALNDPASTRCAHYPGVASDGEEIALHCGVPSRGRWVKVQIMGTAGTGEWLTLCEVKVYGIISD